MENQSNAKAKNNQGQNKGPATKGQAGQKSGGSRGKPNAGGTKANNASQKGKSGGPKPGPGGAKGGWKEMPHLMGGSVHQTLKDLEKGLLNKPNSAKKSQVREDGNQQLVQRGGLKAESGKRGAAPGGKANTQRAEGQRDGQASNLNGFSIDSLALLSNGAPPAASPIHDLYEPSNAQPLESMQLLYPYRRNGFYPAAAPEFYPGPQWRWIRGPDRNQNAK